MPLLIGVLLLPGLLVAQEQEPGKEPVQQKAPETPFWRGQKAMWSSPFQMSRKDAKLWGAFGAATAALIATDKYTSTKLPNTPNQVSFSKHVSRVGAAYTTLPLAGGFYLYGKLRDVPKARETGVLGAEALLHSYAIVAILKIAAGRERPEDGDGGGRFFKGRHSFPSGHAMMSWSFASVISHEYGPRKITPIAAYGLASAVSVSRFTARKHFASDVLAGGAMGWFIGRYVFRNGLDPAIDKGYGPNRSSRFMPSIFPRLDPGGRGYGFFLAWNPVSNAH